MTTKAAEAYYLEQHESSMHGKQYAVYNPLNKQLNELPIIYGFNNGGSSGWWEAVLLAEDGTHLGGHICSDEGYMLHDLGILEGTRQDRHEMFKAHYPDGYRMDFVSFKNASTHEGVLKACELNKQLSANEEQQK